MAARSFQQVMRGRKSPLHNQQGEIFYEIIVKTLVVIVILLTVISFYNIFTKYQNVNYLCRRTVRAIELEGAVSTQVEDIFQRLKAELNLPDAAYLVTDTSYFDYVTKKIQLRQNFTVTVTATHYIEIFNPIFAPTVSIPLPLRVTLTGMSEVFWKP